MEHVSVIVCGGRNYADRLHVFSVLDLIHAKYPGICVVHGAATEADYLAAVWAGARMVEAVAYPADWRTHGRAAGPIRNKQMLIETMHRSRLIGVVAFPGGRGTDNMVRLAEDSGITVWRP